MPGWRFVHGSRSTDAICALVFTLLLALPALGAAECAWVLWVYSLQKSTGEQYSVQLARPTRQECVKEVREFGMTLKEQGYTVSGFRPDSSEVLGQKGTTRFKYFCLPDTVDAREPKAK